jgi:DNA-binding transcriptional LysR family regulator
VDLTAAGRELRAEALRLLADFTAMRERMQAFARGERGRVHVGFTSSAAAHAFTPEVLRLCRSRHPDIALDVSEHNAAEITEAVQAGRMHCGFLRVPVAQPQGLVFEPLLQEPALLAIPLDHRLARQPSQPVALAQLDGERLILVRRTGAPGLYANLLALCAQQGVQVEVAAEVERMMTNVNLVAAGVGLSIVPASVRGAHAEAVVYRAFEPAVRLSAPLTLVYREAGAEGPLATFLALARELAQRHRAPGG